MCGPNESDLSQLLPELTLMRQSIVAKIILFNTLEQRFPNFLLYDPFWEIF